MTRYSQPFQCFTADEVLGPLNAVEKKNAPKTLYAAGHLDLLRTGLRVSVVGTRKPTPQGIERTQDLTKKLIARGVTVVSGLAKGVDAVAHREAIASQGRTVAVLGNPLDVFYPAENRELQQRMMQEHLVVSQFPVGMQVGRKAYPMRNRTMALLSDATIIVEAGAGSGTLHQGWEALRLGRPLLLLDSLVERDDLTWPAEMLAYGAMKLGDENFDSALHEIPSRVRSQLVF